MEEATAAVHMPVRVVTHHGVCTAERQRVIRVGRLPACSKLSPVCSAAFLAVADNRLPRFVTRSYRPNRLASVDAATI